MILFRDTDLLAHPRARVLTRDMESWIVVAAATLAVILAGAVIRGIKKKVVPPPRIRIAFDQYKDRERLSR